MRRKCKLEHECVHRLRRGEVEVNAATTMANCQRGAGQGWAAPLHHRRVRHWSGAAGDASTAVASEHLVEG